ncbi:MAG: hypothetical protein CMI93_02550 [Pelagibacteraceae bacterium]|nr:hypothetical protein [Pelagibacteraceae bacterium]
MQRRYHTNLPFLDLLFNVLIGFVFLFIVSFLLINPIAKRADIEVKAEFLITVFWPDNLEDDVDIYVEDPAGNLVWFKSREPGLMHLDRDDLGKRNDEVVTAAGTILFPENREIVTLRGIVPGEYVVNVHCYFKVAVDPVPVTVQIDKINPYSVVLRETVDLANKGEEITVTRFSVNSKGEVTNINKLPKKLVQEWQKG